ncbi:hypothetical protein FIBSPDRAFT_903252 [Athelia psychrophila]|uniref:Uncharacterized protein n=1 Tax=Athelia psychrophila TaxID=1759441 RepID=A0A167W8Y6_9AGAM|nr:hypothetical protein FIBSPDRAFT_903252 [Fibularhizoctonia sp. CBS 109695]
MASTLEAPSASKAPIRLPTTDSAQSGIVIVIAPSASGGTTTAIARGLGTVVVRRGVSLLASPATTPAAATGPSGERHTLLVSVMLLLFTILACVQPRLELHRSGRKLQDRHAQQFYRHVLEKAVAVARQVRQVARSSRRTCIISGERRNEWKVLAIAPTGAMRPSTTSARRARRCTAETTAATRPAGTGTGNGPLAPSVATRSVARDYLLASSFLSIDTLTEARSRRK